MERYTNKKVTLDDIDGFTENTSKDIININNDKYIMHNMFFAFIDVLGFKQDFSDKSSDKRNEKFMEVFCKYFRLINREPFINDSRLNTYAGQTSDSLYFYTDRVDYLVKFINIFSYVNLYAMSKNVFFRGGISKGKLYIKEPYQFYGDSVIKSYLLENTISKNPIITVDNNTYEDIIDNDKNNEKYFKNYFNRHYLNIFLHLHKENFKPNMLNEDQDQLEKKIQANIKKNLKRFEYEDKNYCKYKFLQKEFNEYKEKNKK